MRNPGLDSGTSACIAVQEPNVRVFVFARGIRHPFSFLSLYEMMRLKLVDLSHSWNSSFRGVWEIFFFF